jgi:HEAT repeat protein
MIAAPRRSRFQKSAAEYYRDYVESWAAFQAAMTSRTGPRHQTALFYDRALLALRGLRARREESLPYAFNLLASDDPDHRQTGASLMGTARGNQRALTALLHALMDETDETAYDAILMALGDLRRPEAVPALAAVVRDDSADPGHRHIAAVSLCKVPARPVARDPVTAAIAWLSNRRAG